LEDEWMNSISKGMKHEVNVTRIQGGGREEELEIAKAKERDGKRQVEGDEVGMRNEGSRKR